MEVVIVFAILSIIVFLGYFSELMFKKTKIPDVLLLIIVGIIIGTVLDWIDADQFGFGSELFATFALIFLLFQGSLSLDFRVLIRSLNQTLKLTIFNFFLTVIGVGVVAYFLGYDIYLSLLIGMILGGTSSAVVIPLVNSVEIKEKYGTILTLESAISDVLCIIGSITVLEIITTGQVVASNIFKSILSSFSLALIVGLVVGLIWISLLYNYEALIHSYLLTVAVVMGLYAFVESPFVESSGAIAALAFGLVMGNSKSIHEYFKKDRKVESQNLVKNILLPSTRSFYSEISFFIKTFFFVYLGIIIDFSNLTVLLYGLLISIVIFLVRPFSVKMAFKNEDLNSSERSYLEILIPKGLAAAVLAGIAVQSGVITTDLGIFANTILSTVFFTILITSILIFFTEKGKFNGILPFLNREKKVKN